MCNVSYNEAANRVEVQQRIFYDDLEQSFQIALKDEKFDILSPKLYELNFDSLFYEYFDKRTTLNINGSSVKLDYLEYEINQDAIVLYFYKENIFSINSLDFHSSVLFELFDDQTNIVSVIVGKQKKSGKFTISSESISFLF
jgi:hypothetical protein